MWTRRRVTSTESRERFLAQWARCYVHQRNECIVDGISVGSQSDWNGLPTPFLPEEPMGNGEGIVECEASSITDLMNGA